MSMNANDKLLTAVKEKRLDLVNQYLKFSSLSTIDWAGNSALHLAVSNNDIDIVKCLIRSGANLNLANKFKKTPLHLACQLGNESIANVLLESGCDINARDMLYMTPLMWSIERNHDNLVILLCGRDEIDLDCIDKFSRTCFDISKRHNNDFIQKVLLNATNNLKAHSNAHHLEMLVDESSTSNMDTFETTKDQPASSTGLSFKIVNKFKSNSVVNKLDDSDEDEDNDDFIYSESKKKRFSFSPIQSAEETLFWLKKQALSSSNEYLLDCELYLTEAGKLALDYLNRNDPVGDQQRLLMRIAKEIENQDKETVADLTTASSNDIMNKFGENLDDWFIDNINFDTDKNEFV